MKKSAAQRIAIAPNTAMASGRLNAQKSTPCANQKTAPMKRVEIIAEGMRQSTGVVGSSGSKKRNRGTLSVDTEKEQEFRFHL